MLTSLWRTGGSYVGTEEALDRAILQDQLLDSSKESASISVMNMHQMKNELPACRIDQLCKRESRVEYELVKDRWPEVFSEEIDGATRNSRWYQQIYKSVKDTKEVLQAHRSFLLYRDAFSGLLLIFLATIAWSLVGDPQIIGEIKPVVFLVQGMLTILSLIAARVAGNRFVVNAVVAAE